VFTPPVASRIEGPLATLVLGASGGGTNWPGGSFDPETHILYVSSNKSLAQLGLVPPRDPSKNDLAFVQGNAASGARTRGGSGATAGGADASAAPASAASAARGAAPTAARGRGALVAGDAAAGPAAGGEGGGAGLTVRGLPIMKPPYGQISAISLDKGEILWQVAHGATPDNIANNPALKGITIPRTGRPGTVGTLVTKTLVVAGEAGFGPTPSGQRGAMLRAYDKASGREAGAVYMPAPQSGSPMTYLLNGKQYIVVAVSGAGFSGELVAFRLN